jgi:hypothetical protein
MDADHVHVYKGEAYFHEHSGEGGDHVHTEEDHLQSLAALLTMQ